MMCRDELRQDELRQISIQRLSGQWPDNRNMGPAEKFLEEMLIEAVEEVCHDIGGTYLAERLAEELAAKPRPVTAIPITVVVRAEKVSLADWFRATHPDAKCVQLWRARHGG